MKVFFSLGSNVGDKQRYLAEARRLISTADGVLKKISPVYETDPWGKLDQDTFLNQCILFETKMSPGSILQLINDTERKIGRKREVKWGPRIIDIDLLFYGDMVLNMENLVIPHPQLTKRRFVLQPLNDIATDFIHPIENQSIAQLLAQCPDISAVRILKQS